MNGLFRRSALSTSLALVALLLSACTTLKSKPVSDADTNTGIRYSLPVPILKVSPQPDGTMALEVLYLPDPHNTYTVEASSIISGYTLNVKVKEGLLDTVTYNSSSTAVAEQALSTYGAIEKAKVDAEAAAAKAAAEEAKTKATAAATAAKTLADAKVAVTIATAKRDKLIELGASKDALITAELAIIDAQQKLAALEASAAANGSTAAMNNVKAGKPSFRQAAGPVFFRMAPGKNGRVDLVAEQAQIKADTSTPPKSTPPEKEFAFSVVPPGVVRLTKDGLTMKIRANKAIYEIVKEKVKLEPLDAAPTIRHVEIYPVVESGETYLYVVFDDDQAPGRYKLSIPVILKKGDEEPVNPVAITVDIRKAIEQ